MYSLLILHTHAPRNLAATELLHFSRVGKRCRPCEPESTAEILQRVNEGAGVAGRVGGGGCRGAIRCIAVFNTDRMKHGSGGGGGGFGWLLREVREGIKQI